MSFVEVLVVAHVGGTAVLLGVLWLVMAVQRVRLLAERAGLRRSAAKTARAAVVASAARLPAVERRRSLQSSA